MTGRWLPVLLLGVLALPGLAASQEVSWTIQPRRGWLGVTLDYGLAQVGGVERTVGIVKLVSPDGPAESAGILPGDTITHVDGQSFSPKMLDALRTDLDPGDLVRVTLRRDGQVREVLVQAETWPETQRMVVIPGQGEIPITDMGEMVIRLDSVRGAILKNLDSLTLSIRKLQRDSTGEVNIEVFRVPPLSPGEKEGLRFRYEIFEPGFDTLRFDPDVFFLGPEVAFPFTSFLVESPVADSLRDAIEQRGRSLKELRLQEQARVQELRSSLPVVTEETLRTDSRIRELRSKEEALVVEQQRLRERLRQVSEEEMKRQMVHMQLESREAAEEARDQLERAREYRRSTDEELRRRQELREEIYTPGRILAVGQSFVAGAQLQPLNPALAEYFRVDEGILVTEVVDGTPAAQAGLRGGDVIVRVGGDPVSSLEDLRFLLGFVEGPLRIRVVRKGEPVDLVVRR